MLSRSTPRDPGRNLARTYAEPAHRRRLEDRPSDHGSLSQVLAVVRGFERVIVDRRGQARIARGEGDLDRAPARSSITPRTSSLAEAPEPGTSSAIKAPGTASVPPARLRSHCRARSRRPGRCVPGQPAISFEADEHLGMVAATGTDARQVGDHGNAVLTQHRGRSEPGVQQQMWRHGCACAEHDLVAGEDPYAAGLLGLDCDGTVGVEHDTPSRDTALDRQIGPSPIGDDVRQCGIDPNAIDDVARQRAETGGPGTFLSGSSAKPRSAHAAANA